MKVAHNDETNPDTQSVSPPYVPRIANLQPHLRSVCSKTRNTGKTFPVVFPFVGITYPRVSSPLTPRIALLYFVMLLFSLLFICFPFVASFR